MNNKEFKSLTTITKEEILKKKEYLRFLTNNLFKMQSKKRTLLRQLEQTEKLIKNYSEEKEQLILWLKENLENVK